MRAQCQVLVGNIRYVEYEDCLCRVLGTRTAQHTLHSALVSVVVVTEALHASTNGITQTESPKQPVIRVTTVVVHGAIVAAVVVACLSGVLPRVRVGARKAAEGRAGRHLDRAGRSLSHFWEVDQSSAGREVARSGRFGTCDVRVLFVCVD